MGEEYFFFFGIVNYRLSSFVLSELEWVICFECCLVFYVFLCGVFFGGCWFLCKFNGCRLCCSFYGLYLNFLGISGEVEDFICGFCRV